MIHNKWFYSNPGLLAKLLTIYVKGDMIVLVPFLLLIALVGLWSVRFMLLIYAIYFTLRAFGEMMYWFFQQFYDLKYRPYDFGLKHLKNKAIYILYQLFSLCLTVIGTSAILYILFFWT